MLLYYNLCESVNNFGYLMTLLFQVSYIFPILSSYSSEFILLTEKMSHFSSKRINFEFLLKCLVMIVKKNSCVQFDLF